MTLIETMSERRGDSRPRYDVVYFPLGAAAFGGAERSILELAAAQQAVGRKVLVCYEAALAATDFPAHANGMGLPLQQVDWAPEHSFRRVVGAAWQLFGVLKTRLIHFNVSWRRKMWVVPMVARLRSGARLVGSMRAMPERYTNTPRRRYLRIIPGLQLWKLPDLVVGRIWARALHATVSVNRDDYPARLVSEFGFSPARLAVIYNGVRIPERLPTEDECRGARARLDCPDNAFVVAYVGRVSQEKGVRYAVEALVGCNPRVHLLVAGEGNDLEASRTLAKRLGLGSRVRFLGYVSEPMPVFAAAHVAVVPSLWNEAFGRVVVEAMGCGIPVVATAVGGMQELFDDGVQGRFVPKANSSAIANAIDRLFEDPERRRQMGAASRELAVRRYSTQRVAAEYGALYDRLTDA
jgi:glycosyltransferase involved in cell wall biosynthesis